jgi:hypothetical protein
MRNPPEKQDAPRRKPSVINGALMDVRTASAFCGWTEKTTRALIARAVIPHRKVGARVVFVRSELEEWIASTLPGVSLEEAKVNQAERH